MTAFLDTQHTIHGLKRHIDGGVTSTYILEYQKLKNRKHYHITDLDRPLRIQEFDATRFQGNRHMKVVMSALRIVSFIPPPRKYP
jgi:hypothetical protein